MSRNKKENTSINKLNDVKNTALKILIPSIISIILLFVLLFMASQIILKSPIDYKSYKYISLVAVMLSAFVGGFISSKLMKKNGMLVGFVSGVPMLFLLTSWVMLFCSEKIDLIFPIAIVAVVVLSSLGGVVGVNLKSIKR